MVRKRPESSFKKWSWREESNLQPAVYKTAALPLSYASLTPLLRTEIALTRDECDLKLATLRRLIKEEFE